MLAACFKEDAPMTIEEKKAFCQRRHIALYDSIESCEIEGSSDASITNVVPANLEPIFKKAKIARVIFNGSTSKKWFDRYQTRKEGVEYYSAPSTSAANASWDLDRLVGVWEPFLLK